MAERVRLLALYDDVARRARATTDAHPWWPCRRGCDTCCRRLANEPELTPAEWRLLREGLVALAPDVRAAIEARASGLASREPGAHVTCPMLDTSEGACLVYAHRPAACRTYGFYVRRADGMHCDLVSAAVGEHGVEDAVVWGNHASVDHALGALSGAARPLSEWLSSDPPEGPPPSPRPSSSM